MSILSLGPRMISLCENCDVPVHPDWLGSTTSSAIRRQSIVLIAVVLAKLVTVDFSKAD